VNAVRGSEPREFYVRLAPRRNIDRVEFFRGKHHCGIRINGGNPELAGTRAGTRRIAVAHGDDSRLRDLMPRSEMVLRDIAGADQADA
jgi:hypothetical protein